MDDSKAARYYRRLKSAVIRLGDAVLFYVEQKILAVTSLGLGSIRMPTRDPANRRARDPSIVSDSAGDDL